MSDATFNSLVRAIIEMNKADSVQDLSARVKEVGVALLAHSGLVNSQLAVLSERMNPQMSRAISSKRHTVYFEMQGGALSNSNHFAQFDPVALQNDLQEEAKKNSELRRVLSYIDFGRTNLLFLSKDFYRILLTVVLTLHPVLGEMSKQLRSAHSKQKAKVKEAERQAELNYALDPEVSAYTAELEELRKRLAELKEREKDLEDKVYMSQERCLNELLASDRAYLSLTAQCADLRSALDIPLV